ncbi:MAG: sodium:solute symporter family protein [Victivallaceae bacterium]|nr:sodium:solute symporter family protein [Victivallaceae bacterium]
MNHSLALSADARIWLGGGMLLYILMVLFIGWWAGRKIKGMADFLVAGRRLPMWMAFGTLLATWFGAGSSMGVCGTVYSDGLPAIISDPFAASLSLLIAGVFFVGMLRRMRLLTVTDVIEERFGKWAGVYASAWMVPVYIGWLGAQILGIGKILNLLTGIEPSWGTIIGAVIILVYTAVGGMWAVTLTDLVQVSLIIIGLALVVPGAVTAAGGAAAIFKSVPAEHLTLLPVKYDWNSVVSYLGQWCVMGLGCVVGQDLIQRSLSSRTDRIAVNSTILAGLAYLALCVVPITIGFAGRIILPELKDSEALLPLLASRILHPLVFTIFLSALVSAIMSSADSSLLAGASLLINNVIKPFCPWMTDRYQLHLTRSITVLITIIATVGGLYVESIYTLMIQSWVSLLVVVFIPVTAALYSKKADSRCIWATMLIGTFVWLGYVSWCGLFGAEGFSDDMLNRGAMYGFASGITVFFVYIFAFRTNPIPVPIPEHDEVSEVDQIDRINEVGNEPA